uniref:Uncharacterized protein n=1 Tax=Leishmania guyanensis TaxID=5670 RepID=A0A1E1IR25_LEIGU|nr:Hypothetical protein BN36_1212240 [Leishmania guyanensis]
MKIVSSICLRFFSPTGCARFRRKSNPFLTPGGSSEFSSFSRGKIRVAGGVLTPRKAGAACTLPYLGYGRFVCPDDHRKIRQTCTNRSRRYSVPDVVKISSPNAKLAKLY